MKTNGRLAALRHIVLHGDKKALLPHVPRMRALVEMEKFGPEALPALDAVKACVFGDKARPSLRIAAVRVLCSIGPGAIEVIPYLHRHTSWPHSRTLYDSGGSKQTRLLF